MLQYLFTMVEEAASVGRYDYELRVSRAVLDTLYLSVPNCDDLLVRPMHVTCGHMVSQTCFEGEEITANVSQR